jgi:NAD(P)-dependent dehydrogenase (short-subunit alcohol dehydrogenase family)
MELSLKGKRAIVTAAGGGIGRKTAELFSKAGAKVFICDIDQDGVEQARADIANLDGMVLDVRDPASFDRLFERADKFLGGLDIMVNNAGVAGPTAKVEDITLEDWTHCVDINLTSAFLGTKYAVPRIKAAGGGSIVNMSSAAGKFGFAMRTPYSAAKWAIVGFTRSVAIEVGPFNIRCNCIQPGPVEGARITRVAEAKAKELGISMNEMRDQMAQITSLRTFIPPEHISSMILYLCSEHGSTISGQALSVDGGMEHTV